jgi:hypothetical protein
MHLWRARQPFHRDGWMYEHKEDGWHVGGRSLSWIKVKLRREGCFVVVGLDVEDGGARD